MKRFGIGFKIGLPLALVILTFAIIYNHHEKTIDLETSNLIIAALSFLVSLVSLAIATMKKPKFEGKVEGWLSKTDSERSGFCKLNLCIHNTSKRPIKDFIFSFKSPESFVDPVIDNNQYNEFSFGDTTIYSCDKVKVLPPDGKITLEFWFEIKKWKYNYSRIYDVALSGSNIDTINYRIYKVWFREMYNNYRYFNREELIEKKVEIEKDEKGRIISKEFIVLNKKEISSIDKKVENRKEQEKKIKDNLVNIINDLPQELKESVSANKENNITTEIKNLINDKKYFSSLYPDLDLKKELLNILQNYKYPESQRERIYTKILDIEELKAIYND